MAHHYMLNPNLIVEELGQEILLLDERSSVLTRINGDAARVFQECLNARDLTPSDLPGAEELVTQGLLRRSGTPPRSQGFSRRTLVGLTFGGGATAIATLALPAAAVASSSLMTVYGTYTVVDEIGYALVLSETDIPESSRAVVRWDFVSGIGGRVVLSRSVDRPDNWETELPEDDPASGPDISGELTGDGGSVWYHVIFRFTVPT